MERTGIGVGLGDKGVRVGVVMPQDRAARLELEVRGGGYSLRGGDQLVDTGVSGGDRVTVRADGAGVAMVLNDEAARRAGVWVLSPTVLRDDVGVVCRDCVAGRGFHWATRIDVVLPGMLEVSVRDGYLFVVNVLPIETYLTGVITAEMSGEAPIEFLKAQCVVARSWMTVASERKHEAMGIDLCNDDCCQRYQGIGAVTASAKRAVEDTAGRVLVHRSGVVVDANYSKSCGGIVESPVNVWSMDKPGQRSVVDAPEASVVRRFLPVNESNVGEYVAGDWLRSCDGYCSPRVVPEDDLPRYLGRVDDGGGYFRWSVSHDAEAFDDLLRRKVFGRHECGNDLAFERFRDVVVTRRGVSGRAARVEIVYDDRRGRRRAVVIDDQYRIREALHESFLYSSAMDVRVDRADDGTPRRVHLRGAGWGHGAGMCQIGALGMALRGFGYEQILEHYFEDVAIEER